MSTNKLKNKAGKENIFDKFVGGIADLLRTSVLASLDVAFLGEEIIENLAKKIAKENELSTTDVKSFIEDVKQKSLEARKEAENRARKVLEKGSPRTKESTYTMSLSKKEEIVEIVLEGEVTEDNIGKLGNKFFNLMLTIKPKYLIVNIRALKRPNTIIKEYKSTQKIGTVFPIIIAVVDHKENVDFQSFLETTAENVGIPLKWFANVGAARVWLRSKQRRMTDLTEDITVPFV
ncbi:MAG: hypothetical protein JW976_12705 [Syntrophaceae bacterium]|nr:hypothetical protein [Syntrophaceae bacterium]